MFKFWVELLTYRLPSKTMNETVNEMCLWWIEMTQTAAFSVSLSHLASTMHVCCTALFCVSYIFTGQQEVSVRSAFYISSLFAYSKCTIILHSLLCAFYHLKLHARASTPPQSKVRSQVRSLSVLPVLLAISFSDHERIIPSPFLTTPSKIGSGPNYLSQCHGQNLWSLGFVKSSRRKSPPLSISGQQLQQMVSSKASAHC